MTQNPTSELPNDRLGGRLRSRMNYRIKSHLGIPLYRNGYALILSTWVTSGLGFIYWVVAARLYPPEVVGLNSAALASLMFLAGLAQFSLPNVVIRFIPRAGSGALALAERASLVTLVAGLLAGIAFVLGLDSWTPSLGFLRASPLAAVCFIVSTGVWGAFVLQEGVLTGFRRATWVPIRNTAFAAGKIALLLLFARLLPTAGILASWMAPAGLALVPVALLIRRRLKPAADSQRGRSKVVRTQIVRYAAADYVGSLFWLAATMLVPLLVTEVAGAKANAHFYLAWTIAYTLYLVAPSMGSSLIVESAIDPVALNAHSRRALLQTARLVIPMVIVVVVAAPYVLRFLGESYADEGTVLLRLLALSAIPNIGNAIYTSIARARRQIARIIGILGAQCILVLLLSYVLLHLMGIVGVGLAWLLSQSLIAIALFFVRGHIIPKAASDAA